MPRPVTRTTRVVLADDEELLRTALGELLSLQEGIEVVDQVADGAAAVDAVLEHRPDVVLLDLEMPRLDGIEAAQQIRERTDTKVVLVTRHARPGVLRRALAVGVSAFASKSTSAAVLATIVHDVAAGGRYIDATVAAAALSADACPLTARELDVLREVRRGLRTSEIDKALHLSSGTVRNYLSSAMAKLGAADRREAADRAWAEGWI